MTNETMNLNQGNANRDPISGAVGAHPVGTGLGAAAGGIAAGALAGSVVGPVGTVIGAVAGALVGGLAGKGVAEMIDPTVEEAYWRDNYSSRPYVASGGTFEDYGPAYRYGVDARGKSQDGAFEASEAQLSRDWQGAKGTSKLSWENAKHATRDAWQRISDTAERAMPGDSDHDGK